MLRTWDRSRFAPWLLRELVQVNEEPTSRLCRRTCQLTGGRRRRQQEQSRIPASPVERKVRRHGDEFDGTSIRYDVGHYLAVCCAASAVGLGVGPAILRSRLRSVW